MNPRWLKLKQAVAYSAMSKRELIELATAEDIVGFQDPNSKCKPWIFDRLSIDKYRKEQAVDLCGDLIYLDAMRRAEL